MQFIKQTDSFKTPNSIISIHEGNDFLYYWKIEGDILQTADYGKDTRHEAIVSVLSYYNTHMLVNQYTFKMTPKYFGADFGHQTVIASSYELAVSKLDREEMEDYDLIEVSYNNLREV
jgi:hypothetical protein